MAVDDGPHGIGMELWAKLPALAFRWTFHAPGGAPTVAWGNMNPIVLRLAFAVLAVLVADASFSADHNKILHVASTSIETLDPQRWNDDPSYQIQCAIYEGLYEWDYLALPSRLVPNTATAAPAITDGGRTWTIRVKPGIHFTDDPAFKGQRRELVAEDYVYSLKRVLDPGLQRGGSPVATDLIVGARAVVDAAGKPGGRFDYDRMMEGLRALDRYTLQLKLTAANYPVIEDLVTYGAVAREVVEAAEGDVRTRAVGTGPYRLKEWKQGSRMILEANPDYRALSFPESQDVAHAALAASMRGKTLPQIGAIEIAFVDEATTRTLEFERGMLDYVALSGQTANRLLSGGRLKSAYTASGVGHHSVPSPYVAGLVLNMSDPVLGGMGNAAVALRRAIAKSLDADELVKVVYAGQAMVMTQLSPPGVAGHDAAWPSRSAYDPAGARALLDRVGYDRKDAQGYRVGQDAKPIVITFTLPSNASTSRELATLVKRNLEAIGLKTDVRMTPFQDAIKEVMAGRYQMFFGAQGGDPTGWIELRILYGKSPPPTNLSRFSFPEYDRAAEQFLSAATEAERVAAARTMSKIANNYAPFIPLVVRLDNWFVQPWISGFSPPVIQTHWKYMDIDVARQMSQRRGK
jgi:ABC-type transport system substrate-binding protein